jgi:hypothetical protein
MLCDITYFWSLEKKRWRILQNMFAFPYKIRVYIVVVSIKIHNYIRNKSQEDVVYIESDRYSNFFLNDFLIDVVSLSQTHGNKRSFYMDYVYDRIATSLMGQ